jgi:hypothetical protein
MNRRALLCRTHLHHLWRIYSTEDGNRYRACARCGKEHWSLGYGPLDRFIVPFG